MFDHDVTERVIGVQLFVRHEEGVAKGVRGPLDQVVGDPWPHVR